MNDLNLQLAEIFKSPWALGFLLLWTIFWKGYALWQAASKKHIVWFILVLVVNTMGLLEIAYVFYLNKWDAGSTLLLKFLQKNLKGNK